MRATTRRSARPSAFRSPPSRRSRSCSPTWRSRSTHPACWYGKPHRGWTRAWMRCGRAILRKITSHRAPSRWPTMPCRCSAATATSGSIPWKCGLETPAQWRPSTQSPPSRRVTIMIDFELEPQVVNRLKMYRTVAESLMRPISREYDEREHEDPWQFFETMWSASALSDAQPGVDARGGDSRQSGPKFRNLNTIMTTEELCWGDAGLFLSIPNSGLGGAAVMAAGTAEQKARFLKRFSEGKPKWGAMAITEPGCGSDSAAITTTAVRDGDHWVINGTKIFCTGGHRAIDKSEGFVVVWATIDKSAGRAGIKPFVVEHGTLGMQVIRLENKLGIRASDTAAIVFDNCRVPADHLLGSP